MDLYLYLVLRHSPAFHSEIRPRTAVTFNSANGKRERVIWWHSQIQNGECVYLPIYISSELEGAKGSNEELRGSREKGQMKAQSA